MYVDITENTENRSETSYIVQILTSFGASSDNSEVML